MASTHIFQGLTGIEFEVSDMTAKHQRMFSEQSDGVTINSYNSILADLVVRIGSLKMSTLTEKERLETVKKIPSEERRKVLFEIRQFTMEFPSEFSFNFPYFSKHPDTKGQKMQSIETVNLSRCIVERPYSNQAEELKDFQMEFEGTFPRSGEQYKFSINNGYGEEIGARAKNPSSHTLILMRQPKLKKMTNKQGEPLKDPVWLVMTSDSLDKLSIKDIEHMRKQIHDTEGNFDSSSSIEHPESHLMFQNQRVSVDVLQMSAFFYPSLTI